MKNNTYPSVFAVILSTVVLMVVTMLVMLAVWNVVNIVKAEPENGSSTPLSVPVVAGPAGQFADIDTPVPIATPALGLPESSVELTCTDLGFAPFGEERYPQTVQALADNRGNAPSQPLL